MSRGPTYDGRSRSAISATVIAEAGGTNRWSCARGARIVCAVTERGLFASQVTACKRRDERTIEVVTAALNLDGADVST